MSISATPLPPYALARLGRRTSGFTLIELMIVVGIVGILAMIALPSFNGQIQKSRRFDATTTLQTISMAQERWRGNHPTFGSLADLGAASTTSGGYYAIRLTGASATGYTLQAVPQNSQASDTCGTLTFVFDNTQPMLQQVSKTPTTQGCW